MLFINSRNQQKRSKNLGTICFIGGYMSRVCFKSLLFFYFLVSMSFSHSQEIKLLTKFESIKEAFNNATEINDLNKLESETVEGYCFSDAWTVPTQTWLYSLTRYVDNGPSFEKGRNNIFFIFRISQFFYSEDDFIKNLNLSWSLIYPTRQHTFLRDNMLISTPVSKINIAWLPYDVELKYLLKKSNDTYYALVNSIDDSQTYFSCYFPKK